MLFVDNQNITDPRINLALEEFLLRQVAIDEPLLLFYINEPSVIIGRNQNTVEEIDQSYIDEHGIHVVRRLSGGGAVYHDLGNLNYSFLTNGRINLHNFKVFLDPVIETLNDMGVQAEMGGNSDILVAGKKVSGNAQYSTPQRMFNHGTLLFDTSIEQMLNALNPLKVKIESKAVQSVRSAVTNIQEHLPEEMDINTFKSRILHGIFKTAQVPQYALSDEDWQAVEQIKETRYGSWEWTVGRSPKFNIQKSGQLAYGKIDARLDVDRGLINSLKLFGNFMGALPVEELEQKLVNVRYERAAIEEALAETAVSRYIAGYSNDEMINLLIGNE